MNAYLLLLLLMGLSVAAPSAAEGLRKKIVEYGWDVPRPDFIRAHIREMERRPFDGLIFRLPGDGRVFTDRKWNEADFAGAYEDLQHIHWQRFTDNFICIYAASTMDWCNDEHWEAVQHNLRLVAKAARLGRCQGICFDPEPYGPNPWAYTQAAHRQEKTFAEYQALVRQRGAQFIQALRQEMPRFKLLTFFQLSLFPSLLRPMDPNRRQSLLSEQHYALLPAFLNGMLDAAGDEVTIIDGNEGAYYYTDRSQYFEVYHRIRQLGLWLIDPALWPRYRSQVQVGQALYMDQYFGLRQRKVLGHYLEPEERAKWFEHNIYWALQTTDEYVWCYSERMNWWKDENVPPGAEEALRSAKRKVEQGEPLGFDLKDIVERARQRQEQALSEKLRPRTAQVPRLKPGTPPPKIDGQLSDAAWQQAVRLEPFVPLLALAESVRAQTTARVVYDQRALYLAVWCQEPRPERMQVVGKQHDDDLWQGDDVEFVISAPGQKVPFFHFMVNPANVFWDSINRGQQEDRSYDPEWQHAARVEKEAWTVEMAIPWAALEIRPQPGLRLRVNVCRQRRQGRELSCWSPMVSGFLEAEHFGTWELR
ncbi:MAG TPA: hypothetical protein EYP85_13395 [Armatimonadetes bacterium]|nr:hypothetical protein [Armatimonadota bacterium]